MVLCQICAGLDLASIIRMKTPEGGIFKEAYPGSNDILYWLSGDDETQSPPASLAPYHATVADLIRNASICNLCRVVHHSITSTVSLLEKITQSTPAVSSILSHRLFLCGIYGYQGLQVMSCDEKQYSSTPMYQILGGVGFSVESDNPLKSIIHYRKIPESPRSTKVLKWIDNWLSDCDANHGHHHASRVQPTRVLEYNKSTHKVVLCSSVPQDAKYAALSHCWGSVQPLTLNSQTAPQLRKGLPIGDFPQTFQDAFWLIEQLNIPYLWIDSLCIFQDSKADWIHESSRMCDVYGNAYLMIAATRAKNCNEGFLGPRDQGYIDIPFPLNGRSDEASAFPMLRSQVATGTRHVYHKRVADFADEPLSKRGWTLQERYLPLRKLHFTRSRVYFDCGSLLEAEDGGRHLAEYSIYTYTWDKKPVLYGTDLQAAMREYIQNKWEPLVQQYSRRSLTVDSDKLPAIAGLAAYISSQNTQKGAYLAGLWNNSLIQGMGWRVHSRDPFASAPKSYVAPSWSWASVNCAVHTPSFEIEELAIVRDVAVYLENAENPFGRVTGGWIHLSVTKLKLHVASGTQEGQYLWFQEGEFRRSVSVEWDSPRYDETGSCLADYICQQLELFLVPLSFERIGSGMLGISGEYLPPCFLIITPSRSGSCPIDNIPQFRRVGLGEVSTICPADGDSYDVGRLFEERFLTDKSNDLLEDIIII